MKTVVIFGLVVLIAVLYVDNRIYCSLAQTLPDLGPKRLVIIKGKMTILNHPELGVTPDSGGTVIFQKVGCDSCYIAASADSEGNYKVTVGDGKYKIIVRNPSSPEFDMLAPDQERFIDTETELVKMHSKQEFH